MKTFTYFLPFLGSAMLLFSLGSCKKNSSAPAPDKNSSLRVNPITADITADYDFNDTTLTKHGWTKTFEDNFDGDLSRWTVLTGGVQYELECNKPANVSAVNGAVAITARKETVTGPPAIDSAGSKTFAYTSGWMISKSTFSASTGNPRLRVVARVKVASGYGLSSIFCTFGTNWPTNGEIICLETYDKNPMRYSTNYSFGTQPNTDDVKDGFQFNPTNGDLSAAYHVYMMDWGQSAITYYIDGNEVEIKTAGGAVPDLFNKAHYLSLRVPVGRKNFDNSTIANIQGGTMYVDYVKIYATKAL